MKKLDVPKICQRILLSALIYFLLDLPVQATGFLPFGSYIGIKNFLPATLALQLGPWGICGAAVGCVVSALLLGTSGAEVVLECICIVVIGSLTWLLWHLGSQTHRIHFKRPVHYLKYLGLLLAASLACGGVSYLFVPGGAFPEIVTAYTALGLLIGIPVNIMANGLFCLEPVLPPPYRLSYAVAGTITGNPESIGIFNEQFEDFAFGKGISQRRIFEIENCIEELAIRILAADPAAEIAVRMNYDDTISARLAYSGRKYNPLRTEKDEDDLDLMSLKLIKHRALRAYYRYSGGINRIHVVI